MAAKRARAAEVKVIKKGSAKAAPKIAAKKSGPAAKAVAKAAPKAPPKGAPSPKAPAKAKAAKVPKASSAKSAAAAKAKAPKASPAKGAGGSNGLRPGDAVPALELVDHDGKSFSLRDLRGESYVVYFYPRDDTPGCTREACGFRDDLGKFERAKVRVIGVSPDKPESHTRFRTKYGLPFTLLSDVDKVAANAFGVWVKKQNYGREYMGIERSTFLVDASGKVKRVWRNVKVDGHSQAVLAEAEAE